jgi:hypothetical protein
MTHGQYITDNKGKIPIRAKPNKDKFFSRELIGLGLYFHNFGKKLLPGEFIIFFIL